MANPIHRADMARSVWLLAPILVLAAAGLCPAASDDPPAAASVSPQQKQRLAQIQRLGKEVAEHQAKGRFAEATAALEKKLALQREVRGPVHDDVGDSLATLGWLALYQGDCAKAREWWQADLALRIQLHGDKHFSATDARFRLADVGLIAALQGADLDRWRTICRLDRQRAAAERLKPADAARHAQAVVDADRALFGKNHPFTARALSNLGSARHRQANLAAARMCFEQALAIFRKARGDDHPDTATCLGELGVVLQEQGQISAARKCFDEALAIRHRIQQEEHPDTAITLRHLGKLHHDRGDYAAARSYTNQALALTRKIRGEDHVQVAIVLTNLGLLLTDEGAYEVARRHLERALAILGRAPGDNREATARVHSSLGLLLSQQGDLAAARPHLEQALALRIQVHGEGHERTRAPLNNLAVLLKAQRDFPAARKLYEQALAIARKTFGENHPQTAIAINNLGTLLREQGDNAAAGPYLEHANRILVAALPRHYLTARSFRNLGVWRQAQGDHAGAQSDFENALALNRDLLGERHPFTGNSLHQLGMVRLAQADFEGARRRLEEAWAIQRQLAGDLLGSLAESEALSFVEATQISRDPLLSVLRQLPAIPAEQAYALVWETRAMASRAVAARRDWASQAREARLLWDQFRDTCGQLARLTQVTPSNPDQAKARLAKQAELTAAKERLERSLAEVNSPFRRQQQAQQASPADLAGRLPRNAALLDVIQTTFWEPSAEAPNGVKRTRHYEAFVLRKADRPPGYTVVWVHLGPAAPIDHDVRTWRDVLQRAGGVADVGPRALNQRPSNPAEPPDRELRRRLWEPLETHLTGCTTVVVVPDAALTGIAWAALPGRKAGSYLLEDYAIATGGYGQQVYDLLRQEPPANDRLLAVGGVRYDAAPTRPGANQVASARGPVRGTGELKPWPYLPGTEQEVEHITNLWPRKDRLVLLKGEEAQEAALCRQVAGARYVHLATHGFFADPQVPSAYRHDLTREQLVVSGFPMTGVRSTVAGRNPLLLSGVVLAGANVPPPRDASGVPLGDDGILTAEEVAELDLRETELVVLSACETGRGEVAGGEGVFGLQRAFGLAGARAVVASLWKVDDRATQVLMGEFYRNLWEKKLGKLEALRQAQLTMLARYHLGQGALRGAGGRRPVDPQELAKARQEKKLTPPFYWAGFVLAGDWR